MPWRGLLDADVNVPLAAHFRGKTYATSGQGRRLPLGIRFEGERVMEEMKLKVFALIRTMVKSSLDSYVLPGTLTGTEILLIYMTAWKRHVMRLALASLNAFFSLPSPVQRLLSRSAQED